VSEGNGRRVPAERGYDSVELGRPWTNPRTCRISTAGRQDDRGFQGDGPPHVRGPVDDHDPPLTEQFPVCSIAMSFFRVFDRDELHPPRRFRIRPRRVSVLELGADPPEDLGLYPPSGENRPRPTSAGYRGLIIRLERRSSISLCVGRRDEDGAIRWLLFSPMTGSSVSARSGCR
jgi:hypothetical protein